MQFLNLLPDSTICNNDTRGYGGIVIFPLVTVSGHPHIVSMVCGFVRYYI